ncbi:MAG: hypothetical protein EHM64_11070 [Ignavibacteriae bacterium]|nr:MAG: hypothetical protein EHM64_11070 [Ignavibacteriota bacterium]
MSRTKFAIYAGLIFGIVDILPMLVMDLPDKGIAIVSAFINRFAIGFIIPLLGIKLAGWQKGLVIGILLSLPDAIITKAYIPILSFGIAGGLIIGIITDRYNKKISAPAD